MQSMANALLPRSKDVDTVLARRSQSLALLSQPAVNSNCTRNPSNQSNQSIVKASDGEAFMVARACSCTGVTYVWLADDGRDTPSGT